MLRIKYLLKGQSRATIIHRPWERRKSCALACLGTHSSLVLFGCLITGSRQSCTIVVSYLCYQESFIIQYYLVHVLSWFLSTIREQVNNKSHQEFLYFNLLDTLLCLDAMRITYNLGQLPIPKFTYWVMLVVEEMFHIQVMRGTGQHLPELILYTRANTQESLWEDGPHVSSMVEHWRHNARDMVLAPTWGRLPFPPLSFPFFLWFLWFLLESLISCSMSLWEPGIANHSHGGRSAAHLAVPIDTGAAFYSAMHFAWKDLCDGVIFGHLKSNASFLPPMVKTKEKKREAIF